MRRKWVFGASILCLGLVLACINPPPPRPAETVPTATVETASEEVPESNPISVEPVEPAPEQETPIEVEPPTPSPEPPSPEPEPSPPEPAQADPIPASPEETPAPVAVEEAPPFDPATITPEEKTATLFDARSFVEQLNSIIAAKDFEKWQSYLTDEYRKYWSDPVVLGKLSQVAALKRAGIELKTLQDYFFNVVFRARQNMKVDDIEFTGPDSITAITLGAKGDRLVLYYLERQKDTWKIGIGRQQ